MKCVLCLLVGCLSSLYPRQGKPFITARSQLACTNAFPHFPNGSFFYFHVFYVPVSLLRC